MNLDETTERLKSFQGEHNLLIGIAESEIERGIRERTAKGVDANGSAFAPYTPRYAKYGRLKKGLKTSPVNLRVKTEDSLLDLLGSQAAGEIGFPSDNEGQVKGLSSKREFLGVNPEDVRRIEDKFISEFERMLA